MARGTKAKKALKKGLYFYFTKNRNRVICLEEQCEIIQQQPQYLNKTDEELVSVIQKGNNRIQEYILDKYKPLVKAKARAYFLIGADREDIIQEGMIGLYKAIRDYQPHKNASFHVFAELCINRQIITAIKAATRQKHIPLNSYVSLNKAVFEEESEQTYMDLLKDCEIFNPEALFIGQEDRISIERQMGKVLSEFETKVLAFYLQGKSYYEIAKIIQKPEKSIDNALQRVKKKVEKFLEEKRLDA